MAAPFSFSAGDFIAAIGLIRDVTRALRDSGGALEECRELIYELHGLETALLEVKALDFEVDQRAQRVALRHAATHCQNTVDIVSSTRASGMVSSLPIPRSFAALPNIA
jgi:hypothetical protein